MKRFFCANFFTPLIGGMFFVGVSSAAFNSSICTTQSVVPIGECIALGSLYDDTNGDSWFNKYKWGTVDLKEWAGVTITNGHVSTIYLKGNNLEGEISSVLGVMPELRQLNLGGNKITGEIPAEIGNIASLVDLDLRDNQLSGALPGNLVNLENLQTFNISNNQFDRKSDFTALIPSNLQSWYSNMETSNTDSSGQSDVVAPVLSNPGNVISPLNSVFTFSFDIEENSYATNTAGIGMNVSFSGSEECSKLMTSNTVDISSGNATISINPQEIADGEYIDCIVTVADHGNQIKGGGDSNSNTGELTISPFIVDTLSPEIPVVTNPEDGTLSSNNMYTFTGTTEAHAVITVTGPNNESCSIKADDEGIWACELTPYLQDGLSVVKVVSTDFAGNISDPAEISLTIDTVSPESVNIVNPSASSFTNDSTPSLNGTGESGTTIVIKIDGTDVTTFTIEEDGQWIYELTDDQLLSDGSHTITATLTDTVGNVSEESSHSFTVDTTAPNAPNAPDVTASWDSGKLDSDNITLHQTPEFTGSCSNGDTVTLYIGEIEVTPSAECSNGKYSIVPNSAFENGSHEITVKFADPNGNTSEISQILSLTIDSIPPTNPIIESPTSNIAINDKTPEVSGTAESGSTVVVNPGNSNSCTTITSSDGDWKCTLPEDLPDGNHSMTAVSIDIAGNESSQTTFSVEVDTTIPSAPTIISPKNGSIITILSPTVEGIAKPGSTVYVTGPNGENCTAQANVATGAWSCTISPALPVGDHILTVSAVDVSGKRGAATLLSIGVDPDWSGVNPITATNGIDDRNPVISGVAPPYSTIVVEAGNGKKCLAVANSSGFWSCQIQLSVGDNPLTMTTTDPSGNTSVLTTDIYVNGTPTGPSVGNPTSTTTSTTTATNANPDAEEIDPNDIRNETVLNENCSSVTYNRLEENRGLGVNASYFADASSTHSAYSSLLDLGEQGIITGDRDTKYARLDDNINRAEFVKVMTISREDTLKTGSCIGDSLFPDVAIDSWFNEFVQNMEQHEIVQGYPDGYYRPGKDINLAETYKIVAISFGYITKDEADTISRYDNVDWYVPYKNVLGKAYLIPNSLNGREAGHFVTRGQMMELLSKVLMDIDNI